MEPFLSRSRVESVWELGLTRGKPTTRVQKSWEEVKLTDVATVVELGSCRRLEEAESNMKTFCLAFGTREKGVMSLSISENDPRTRPKPPKIQRKMASQDQVFEIVNHR